MQFALAAEVVVEAKPQLLVAQVVVVVVVVILLVGLM
jgi:hypothetical protein